MRLLSLLVAGALAPALGLARSDVKAAAALSMLDLRSPKPLLRLDDPSFDSVILSQREYAVAVVMTALHPRVGCRTCVLLQPELEVLARALARADPAGKAGVALAMADYEGCEATFRKFGIANAPLLYVFPPTVGALAPRGLNEPTVHNLLNIQNAERLHELLARKHPHYALPAFNRPVNLKKLALVLGGTVAAGLVVAAALPYVLPILQYRNLWAGFSMIAILLFISGHMYNQIRGTQFVTGNGRGGIMFIAPGLQQQLGLETQMIAGVYALLAYSVAILALRVPRMTDPALQKAAVMFWLGVIWLGYGVLLRIFQQKHPGFPFWLPPF